MFCQAPAMPTKVTLAQLSFESGKAGPGGAKFCPIWKKGNPDTGLSLNMSGIGFNSLLCREQIIICCLESNFWKCPLLIQSTSWKGPEKVESACFESVGLS